jgi:hypothetical protein
MNGVKMTATIHDRTSDGDDLEQRDHVFARRRLRHRDRQEARDGNQRADQHRDAVVV